LVKHAGSCDQAAMPMSGLGATFLSILMIAAFALAAGGIHLLIRRNDRKKGILMLVAAAVMFGNVLVWTI
jgi:high-affinity Fe2+/Pb2+ permease